MSQHAAIDMMFLARWGNSCGMEFDAKEFIRKHPQWLDLADILEDRGGNPWVCVHRDMRSDYEDERDEVPDSL
jgi:hypothetical protein